VRSKLLFREFLLCVSDFAGVFFPELGEIGRDSKLVSSTYADTIAGAKQLGDYFLGISPLVLFMKWVAKLKWFFCFRRY
jgi:hypothetical protein